MTRPTPDIGTDRAPLLVTGSHRSGTTWLGRMLAAADGLHYVQEPFNIVAHQRWLAPRPPFQFFMISDENEAEWRGPVERVVSLQYPLAAHLAMRPPLRQARRATRVALEARRARRQGCRAAIKDPIAVFSTPWLCRRYGARPVVSVREPVAFVGSLVERGWDFDFTHWTRQPALMDVLAEHAEAIERMAASPGDIVDQGIVMWNAIYGFVADISATVPGLVLVSYERLAADPLAQVESLYGTLQLEFGDAQRREVERLSHGGGSGSSAIDVRRDSRAALRTGRARLGDEQCERVERGTAAVAARLANG